MVDEPLLPTYDGACLTNVVPALLHPPDVLPGWLPAAAAGAPRVVLLVEAPGAIALSTEAPVHFARPSIDVLFETAAEAYGAGVLAVLLTGASADGAAGLAHVKALGGRAIVQDPATAECATMPAAGIAAAPVDYILPLDRIADHIVTLVEGRRI